MAGIVAGVLFTPARKYLKSPAVVWERRLRLSRRPFAFAGRTLTWLSLSAGAVFAGALMLPIAPVHSGLLEDQQ